MLVSDTVQLIGPVAEVVEPAAPPTGFGEIGTYTVWHAKAANITVGAVYTNASIPGSGGLPGGSWRVVGVIGGIDQAWYGDVNTSISANVESLLLVVRVA